MKSSHNPNPACAKLNFICTDQSCLFVFLTAFSLILGGCSTRMKPETDVVPPMPIEPPREESIIPFRAVIIQKNLGSVPLESFEIHGSPASDVEPLFEIANKEHVRLCDSIEKEIDAATEVLIREQSRLSEAKEDVATNYNAALPKKRDLSSKSTRDDLESLSTVRAQKSKTDAQYEAAVESKIRPLEQQVAKCLSDLDTFESRLYSFRAEYNIWMFNALPASPSKTWVTDSDGHSSISVAKNEPWYVWISGERLIPAGVDKFGVQKFTTEIYHWILITPDDLDDNGRLFADNRNLLSVRGLGKGKSIGDLLPSDDVKKRLGY